MGCEKQLMQYRSVIILILYLMTIAQISTDIYLPSLPAMKVQLATNDSLVQLTFSIFMAGFAISQLFYGPLSDRYGRKIFLLIGMGLYVIASIAAAFANSITLLLILASMRMNKNFNFRYSMFPSFPKIVLCLQI
jgi:DHA1 family bicyclomycin/chloramphenicol resistance-like MFS transporter